MLIDTHCHLDFPDFDRDREEVIQRAKQQGIAYIINIGSSLSACKKALDLARNNDFIYASLGLHPHEAEGAGQSALREIKELAAGEKIVAIGETGLDYYLRKDTKKLQEALFRDLIAIAGDRCLPLIIHNRDADADVLRILNEEYRNGKIKGVVHCFSSDEGFMDECLRLGLYVSFTCNITYSKSHNLRSLLRDLPLNRLLLETDAPFLPPQIYRGKRNEPANVRVLAEEIARIKNLSFDEVAAETSRNAKELFSLP